MQVNSNSYLMNAYAASASYSQGNFSFSGSYLEITGGVNSSSKAQDGVDLSSQLQELMDRVKNLDVFKCIFPNNDIRKDTKSLDEVGSDFQKDFANFAAMFGNMTSMFGLGSDQSFTMGLNGTGGLTVDGDDAGKAEQIQNSLNGPANTTSTFTARFAVMAARASLVDAGNTLPGFKDAYGSDPIAAINDNIEALKERLLGFRTETGNGSMNYGFIRSFSAKFEFIGSAATNSTEATEEAAAEEAKETEATEVA